MINLASYATPLENKRVHPPRDPQPLLPQQHSLKRNEFQRDRDRIIHSRAFQRLRHKTQVFVSTGVNQYRSRLTHSLEVAQIARALARGLNTHEDLAESIALVHDVGHPPFGHAGEEAISHCMADFGGFDHNVQAVRLVTQIEWRYPSHPGLNLSYAVLDGMIKHNGPLTGAKRQWERSIYSKLLGQTALDFDKRAGLEAQLAAIADDIAYLHHDLDDGIASGLISLDEFADENRIFKRLVAKSREAVEQANAPAPWRKRLIVDDVIRCGFGEMVNDAFAETKNRLALLPTQTYAAIIESDRDTAALSSLMQEHQAHMREFLFSRLYRHVNVNRENAKGQVMITRLFQHLLEFPQTINSELAAQFHSNTLPDRRARARIIADYLSALTDNEAKQMYLALLPQ